MNNSGTVTTLNPTTTAYEAVENDGSFYVVYREQHRVSDHFTQQVVGKYVSMAFAERNARLMSGLL